MPRVSTHWTLSRLAAAFILMPVPDTICVDSALEAVIMSHRLVKIRTHFCVKINCSPQQGG